uniref:Uncharacterized protein n=1 Tax=Streptomyces sp. NBC_00003 TaxID=2903608 RepID=A0AAU2V7J3_9ACTN
MNHTDTLAGELYDAAAARDVPRERVDAAAALLAHAIRVDRHNRQASSILQWVESHPMALMEYSIDAAERVQAGPLSPLLRRYVTALHRVGPARTDHRPPQHDAWPLTSPEDLTHPAYLFDYEGPAKLNDLPRPVQSRQLVGTVLAHVVAGHQGAASVEPATGVVHFSYRALPGIYIATPAEDPKLPHCTRCGQWEREHTQASNATSCGSFLP